MDKEKENEKEEKKEGLERIEVDKDFLMKILKSLNVVKEEVKKIKQGSLEAPASPVSISSQPDYVFQCAKTISTGKRPTTPEEIAHYQQINTEFEAELQPLMRKYKVIQLTAVFLKKL